MGKVDLAGKLEHARARVEAETPVEERALAKFARLARKDARIRSDQDAALAALAKTLMRRRPAKSERITENTLIRIAIDLLLVHADQLRGSTEDELRHSLTREVRNPRTPELPEMADPAVRPAEAAPRPASGIPAVSERGPSDVRASRTPRLGTGPSSDAVAFAGDASAGGDAVRR